MILTLKGATFTNNIGTLDSYYISYYGNGVSGSPRSVKKGAAGSLTCTLTIAEGYTYKSLTVSIGGTTFDSDQYDIFERGSTVEVVISEYDVTGNITINVVTESSGTVDPDEPVVPEPSDTYTFTINPTPATATVTLTAEGYTQNGNSINVPSGTVVTYTTAADKYKTRSNETITITEDTTKEVALAALPYASGATMPSNGVVPEDMFVKLPDTWINSSGTSLDQILVGGSGITIGYNCCYLPIDISGYTSIDLTAQTTAACYYQFFNADGKWTMTGTRQKVDKGASTTASIPSGAKYLLLAESRTNSNDANAVDGYLKYFPVSVKIY